jgi:integrase-like protein
MTAIASDGSLMGAGGAGRDELDVGGYLRQWLAHARGRVRAVTYEGYEALLRRHAMPRIGHLQLRHLQLLEGVVAKRLHER